MPNSSQNVNNFLNFPAEKSKPYANRYSFVRIFAEKRLNGAAHSSDVSAAHGIINPSVFLPEFKCACVILGEHRCTGFGLIAAF